MDKLENFTVTHQKRLKNKLVEFQEQLKPLQRKKVYSEKFEEEVREIVDALNILITNNSIFQSMTNLDLPEQMDFDWSDNDTYEGAHEKLQLKLKESSRAIKSALLFLDTHPAEEEPFYSIESPLTPLISKTKQEKPLTRKNNDIKETKPDKFVVKLPFLDINLSTTEFIIFFIGLVVGVVIGFIGASLLL